MIQELNNNISDTTKLMQLKKACRGFEAIMVQKMLEEMDKTVPKDSLIKNDAQNDIYKSMYIDALAKKMTDNSPFGIGKILFNSLKEYVEYKKHSNGNIKIKKLKQENFKPLKSYGQVTADKDYINKVVDRASKMYSVPKKLIYGIIKAESDFNPNAVSAAGAVGLMQLMPQTALDLGVKNAWSIEENVMGGVKYISQLLNQFKDEKLAVAAYNAGPENVKKYKGIPPFKETKNYVKKVLAYAYGRD